MEADEDIGEAANTAHGRDGVGTLLRTRRLELGMSHADVAGVVKMSTRRIIAIEEERWDELPDGPYLRGFLRNIARALQLDATTLIDRVDGSLIRARAPETILVPHAAARATLPRRSGPLDGRQSGRMLIVGAFAFALVAALIAWSGTESFDRTISGGKALLAAQSRNRDEPAVGNAEPAPTAAIDSSSTTPAAVGADGPAPTAITAGPDAVAAAPPSATVASGSALAFHFSEPSWVEVRDADGKILLQRLNAAGSEQEVEGTPPFSLIVGNAKGVELRFRGQPVDLALHTRDQVARFALP